LAFNIDRCIEAGNNFLEPGVIVQGFGDKIYFGIPGPKTTIDEF